MQKSVSGHGSTNSTASPNSDGRKNKKNTNTGVRIFMRTDRILKFFLLLTVFSGLTIGCSGSTDSTNPELAPSGEFNIETAIMLGELSLVAYEQLKQCIETGKDAITVPAPFQLEEVIYEGVDSAINPTCNDDTSVVPIAFIATEGKNIYLAFRGTANISDALADILHTQVPYSLVSNGGKVSEGFLNKYMGTDTNPIRATIFSKLDELVGADNYDNLYVTGHSMGGALAVTAFPDLSQNLSIANLFLYNFAEPAVGDSDFVSTYQGEYGADRLSWRVVNTNDVVPELPPLGLDCTDLMYAHVSGKHDITFGVTLPDLPNFNDFNCNQIAIKAAILAYSASNLGDIVTNHEMCTYFKTLCNEGSDPSTCDQRAIGCDSE
jgi:hypothetical protein